MTNCATILTVVFLLAFLCGCSEDTTPAPSGGVADTIQESGAADGDQEGAADSDDEVLDSTNDPGDQGSQEDTELADSDTVEPDSPEEVGDTNLEDQITDSEDEPDLPSDLGTDTPDDSTDLTLDGPADITDASGDAPDDTAAEPEVTYVACNAVPGTAGLVSQTKNEVGAPSPAVEGTIVTGTYHMSSDVLYGEAGSSDVQTKQRWDVTVVDATELTVEIAFQQTGPTLMDSESYTATLRLTGGTSATLEYTCISSPRFVLNDPISIQVNVEASGNSLEVYIQEESLTRVLTFTLMS